MWWSTYWWTPWMFVGPMMMMILFAVACAAMMIFMMRGHRHRTETSPAGGMMDCCRIGAWPARKVAEASPTAADGSAAFTEYRNETLRRLEQEQAEFQGFLEHLRLAKDKAEFDAFMAERRQRGTARDPREAVVGAT
jgi:uncharacterized protein DUF2852